MKYPRTFHLPWSLGKGSDDKVLTTAQVDEYLLCKPLVISEKLDGENTTMTNERIYARSLDSVHHDSRSYVKNMWARVKHLIPENIRIHGENMYAQHSIRYEYLPEYFIVFAVSDGDRFLSVDAVQRWAEYLGFPCVRFISDVNLADLEFNAFKPLPASDFGPTCEGYVVRNSGAFDVEVFHKNVAKFVRHNHVQTDKHWMYTEIIRNGLKVGLNR